MYTSKFFNMGRVFVTHKINYAMKNNLHFMIEDDIGLKRFAVKDWGCLSDEDKTINNETLQYPDNLYLLGAYQTCKGRIWIITNRISESSNATTVSCPEER